MRLREYSFRFVSFSLKRVIESVEKLNDVTLLSDASVRIVGRASNVKRGSLRSSFVLSWSDSFDAKVRAKLNQSKLRIYIKLRFNETSNNRTVNNNCTVSRNRVI